LLILGIFSLSAKKQVFDKRTKTCARSIAKKDKCKDLKHLTVFSALVHLSKIFTRLCPAMFYTASAFLSVLTIYIYISAVFIRKQADIYVCFCESTPPLPPPTSKSRISFFDRCVPSSRRTHTEPALCLGKQKKQATRLLFLFLISAQSLKNESEPTANVPIT